MPKFGIVNGRRRMKNEENANYPQVHVNNINNKDKMYRNRNEVK